MTDLITSSKASRAVRRLIADVVGGWRSFWREIDAGWLNVRW